MPLSDLYLCEGASGYITAFKLKLGRKRFLGKTGFNTKPTDIFTYFLFNYRIHSQITLLCSFESKSI